MQKNESDLSVFHPVMKTLLNFFLRISAKCRVQRLRRFCSAMHLSGSESMLDVGGGGDWNWDAVSFITPITVINLQLGLDIPGRIS
jgi:hypothetical protein